jgi:hypothetical protein
MLQDVWQIFYILFHRSKSKILSNDLFKKLINYQSKKPQKEILDFEVQFVLAYFQRFSQYKIQKNRAIRAIRDILMMVVTVSSNMGREAGQPKCHVTFFEQ